MSINTANPHIYIKSRFWKHWLASLLASGILVLVLTRISYIEVENLLTIEFASDATVFENLVNTADNLERNTYIDFLFMIGYTALFYFSGRVVYDLLQFTSRKLLFILFFPLIFDLVENVLLLQMLGKSSVDYLSFSTFYYAVRLKWLFAIPGTIVLIITLFYHLYALLDRIYEAKKKNE